MVGQSIFCTEKMDPFKKKYIYILSSQGGKSKNKLGIKNYFVWKLVLSHADIRNLFFNQRSPRPLKVVIHNVTDTQTDTRTLQLND